MLLTALDSGSGPSLDEATRRLIREGLVQAGRGEFADDADIEAMLDDRHA